MTDSVAARAPRIRAHGAGAGLAWVRGGLRLFLRQPLSLVVLVGLGPLVLGTLQVVPLLGDLAALVLTPAMALGMLAVCRNVADGLPPTIACYAAALRDPLARLRLLQVGVYYALFAGLVALAFTFVPAAAPAGPPVLAGNLIAAPGPVGGADPAIAAPGAGDRKLPDTAAAAGRAGAPPATPELGTGNIPLPAALALIAVMVPFAMTVWFAPVLAGWHHLSAPKALFFSFFACWRNRGAMLVYLVTLLGLWVLAALIVGTLINLLNAREGLAPYLLVAPLIFLTLAVSQTCSYAMMNDVIDANAVPDDGAGGGAAAETLPPA